MRLASPEHLNGIEILRRGYNFTDGTDGFGHLDAGLFFIAFVRNPVTQFVPMQNAISRDDALNEYITHTGTAVFACPPGLREGDTSPTGVRRCSTEARDSSAEIDELCGLVSDSAPNTLRFGDQLSSTSCSDSSAVGSSATLGPATRPATPPR